MNAHAQSLGFGCLRAGLVVLAWTGALAAYGQQGNVQHVHDPVVIKDGDWYWLFSTGGRIPSRKSRDLFEWQFAGDALPELPDWARRQVPEAKDRWAPDISFFNGRYHLYYSVSTFGSNRSCIGLVTNVTLDPNARDYRWEDHGRVVCSMPNDNYNCIDPNVVMDRDGVPWLSFGSFWSGIKLTRLDSKTGKPVGPLVSIADRRGGAIEAPFIVRHGDWYFLFVSFDRCCQGVRSDYKIVVSRSRKVDGPYVDYTGKRMTDGGGSLVLAGYGKVRGPGHNGFLTTPDGDFLVHHFYDGANNGIPTLQIRPVLWASDGWPVVGGAISRTQANKKPTREAVAGRWLHIVEAGEGGPLTLHKDGTIENGIARWTLSGDALEMRWPRNDAPNGAWVDKCFVDPDGRWYSGRNQNGMLIRGVRQGE